MNTIVTKRNIADKAREWQSQQETIVQQLVSMGELLTILKRHSLLAELAPEASSSITESLGRLHNAIEQTKNSRMPRYLMHALSDEAERIQNDRLRFLGDLTITGQGSNWNSNERDESYPITMAPSGDDRS